MNTSATRYLPTYQDAIVSYSLRLPTYRSSYIRRYHPYGRYTTPIVQEQFTDEIDYDEPLDLSILDQPVEPTTIEDENQRPNMPWHVGEEQSHEPLVPTVDAEVINIDNGESNAEPDQNTVFIRVDVTSNS